MASVIYRSESWYAKFKGPDGKPRRERINAATKAEAKRLADDLERKAERQRRGLEPMLPKNGGGTVGAMLEWWLETYSKRTASHVITEKVLRRHFLSAPLAAIPVGLLTHGMVESFLVEKEATLKAGSVNHLRRFLLTAFNRSIECDRFVGVNPVVKVKRRRVTSGSHDYLRPHEVAPLLTALDESFRPLFATAIYTGLRKGELMALRRQDVDLNARLLTVGRSWERDSTKGGHGDRIPLAREVLPFLEAAMRASPSQLIFPAADGSMRSREFAVEAILRRAMGRAGLTTGYTHVCRRKGCGHVEEATTADTRRCPDDGRKLWPKAKVRPLRFHDLRHTTASLLMQAGASPAAVQRILRHRDVRITTDVYGHLAPKFLRAEVDKLTFDVATLVPQVVEEPVRLVANMSPQGPYGVQGESTTAARSSGVANSSTTADGSEAVPARFERATPGFGGQYSIQLSYGTRRGCVYSRENATTTTFLATGSTASSSEVTEKSYTSLNPFGSPQLHVVRPTLRAVNSRCETPPSPASDADGGGPSAMDTAITDGSSHSAEVAIISQGAPRPSTSATLRINASAPRTGSEVMSESE